MTSRFKQALGLVLCATLIPASALAQTSPEAEARNDEGKELFKNKDYAGAAQKFEEAVAVAPRPALLLQPVRHAREDGRLPASPRGL